MIDVVHQISSVDRQVGRRTLKAGEARTITVSRVHRHAARGSLGRLHQSRAHFALVPPDLRRPAPGRPLRVLKATRPGRSSAASRPTAWPRRGSTAARPRGSSCASRSNTTRGHAVRARAHRPWRHGQRRDEGARVQRCSIRARSPLCASWIRRAGCGCRSPPGWPR